MNIVTRVALGSWLALAITMAVHAEDVGHFETIPNACEVLTESSARGILGQPVRTRVRDHIPVFYSQCNYVGTGKAGFRVIHIYKFQPRELVDAGALSPEQLDFNALFITGGKAHVEKLEYPGEKTYVFRDDTGEYSYLLMFPGIHGPVDGAGQDTMLTATYQLWQPALSHEQRRDILIKQAWRDMARWTKQGQS